MKQRSSIILSMWLITMILISGMAFAQPSPIPDWTAESNMDNARLGYSLTAADVNGDGYDDAVVGADKYGNGQAEEGLVFVWYGSEAGLGDNGTPPNADWRAESDQEHAFLASSVSGADVNGDGYSDVIVGADSYDNGQAEEGVIFVWYGSETGLGNYGTPSNADWMAESDQAYAYLGFSSAGADVNGDGYDDVVAGANGYSNGQTNEGAVFVWYGSETGLGDDGTPSNAAWRAEGDWGLAVLGSSVSSADVNGDGYDDIVAGAGNYDDGQAGEGAVFVWYGSETGLGDDGTPSNADWMAESNQVLAHFGYSLTSADVNCDGYDEVIIGAESYDDDHINQGAVFVWYGSEAGLGNSGIPSNADWRAKGSQDGINFGSSVSSADVNGDSYDDVVIGAKNYDGDHINQGAVLVWHGSETGLGDNGTFFNVDWMVVGDQTDATFGSSVDGGDVNGDGYDEVIIGAMGYSNGHAGEGMAFVWYGVKPLAVTKIAQDLNGPPLYEGDIIQYTITATNSTTDTITGVVITDAIPAYTTYVTDSASPPQTSGPDPLVWANQSISASSAITYQFQVVVDAGAAGQVITNVAELQEPGKNPIQTPPIEPPDGGQVQPFPISLVKLADDLNGPPLLVGDEIEYLVLAFNAASITVTNVWIEDSIPANTTYVAGSAATTHGTLSGPNPLRVDIASLPPQDIVFVNFRATVDPITQVTTITNTVTAGISDTLMAEAQAVLGPVGGDNEGLAIGKVAVDLDGPPLYEGDIVEYVIGLANTDDVTHTHVVMTDAIPYGTAYVPGSADPPPGSAPAPLVWMRKDLPPKGIVFFSFQVTVDAGMAGQSIGGNIAVADSDQQEEPVETPPIFPALVEPPGYVSPLGLSIVKTAADLDGPPLYEGDVIEYAITVTNHTTDTTHTNVVVEDAIPAGLTYVPDSASPSPDSGPNPLVWTAATLTPGQSQAFSFQATVDEGMVGKTVPGNVATVVSDQQEDPVVTPPVTPGDPVVRPQPSSETSYLYLPVVLRQHGVILPPPPDGDDYEPDNACAEANSIALGSPQTHTFDPAGDEDWVTFPMQAGYTYIVQTGDLQGGADTILQLYASDCIVLLAENDDYSGELWSRIQWTATVDGAHYVRVFAYDPAIAGPDVGYTISVQEIAP